MQFRKHVKYLFIHRREIFIRRWKIVFAAYIKILLPWKCTSMQFYSNFSPDKKVNVINSDQRVLREMASKPESFFPQTFFPTFREFISSRIS